MRAPVVALTVVSLVACGGDEGDVSAIVGDAGVFRVAPTQVVAVVQPDEQLEAHVRTVDVQVRAGADGEAWELRHNEVYDMQALAWPLLLAIVPAGGDASRGYQLSLEARDAAGELLVTRTARSSFVQDALLALPIRLVASCQNRFACGDGLTCTADGCTGVAVDPRSLGSYAD